MTDALLSDNDRKEALSLAYLDALAGRAGYETARADFDRDSVDLIVKAGGGNFPQLGIQAKATSSPDWQEDGLHFRLKRKNFDDLRAGRLCPALLVVLELPADEREWLECTAESLVLRRSAVWLSLKGYPEIEGDSKVVVLPKDQRLDPDTLIALMARVREGQL